MQNNIPTLYILELDSFVVKSAILCLFAQKIKNVDRVAMVTVTQAMWACVKCWYVEYFMLKQCLEMKARGFCMHVFLVE